jgi:hypothetical protein
LFPFVIASSSSTMKILCTRKRSIRKPFQISDPSKVGFDSVLPLFLVQREPFCCGWFCRMDKQINHLLRVMIIFGMNYFIWSFLSTKHHLKAIRGQPFEVFNVNTTFQNVFNHLHNWFKACCQLATDATYKVVLFFLDDMMRCGWLHLL